MPIDITIPEVACGMRDGVVVHGGVDYAGQREKESKAGGSEKKCCGQGC